MDTNFKNTIAAITIVCFAYPSLSLAQNVSEAARTGCDSPDAEKRLVACTAIIDAKGFGSQSRLAAALDGRCWAYNAKGQFNLAIADCVTAIALRPSYFYAYNNLGTAYLGIGDYENALTVLNRAIDLKPDFFWSRVNRAKAYAHIGKNEEAIKDYEYAVTLDPTNEEIRHALAGLKARPSASIPSTNGRSTVVPMQNEGGTYVVPVLINNTITLNFVLDSGAADVSIPADVVSTLFRTGTIDRSDFIGAQTYTLADGSSVPSVRFRLRSLKVGDSLTENVIAGVAPAQGSLLLGQSFLSRFKSWCIDNSAPALLLSQSGALISGGSIGAARPSCY